MFWFMREAAKIFLNFVQQIVVFPLRKVGIITFPVPTHSSMRKTSSHTIFHYYISGLTTFLPIATVASYQGILFDETTKVLDFGCGVGRQLLHLTRAFPRAEYFACDVDSSSIKFITDNYPMVHAYVNQFTPPLTYGDGEMNLVYSVSTFSHFDLPTQRLWLEELFRITKPGGIVVLTIEGRRALPRLVREFGDEAAMREVLQREGILYKEYWWLKEVRQRRALTATVDKARGLGSSYGSMIMTPDFVRRNWTFCGFEVAGVAEGIIDMRQDLVALRRPIVTKDS